MHQNCVQGTARQTIQGSNILRLISMAIDEELPDDVLKEILSRLPVKSLLRFLSVSKYWYSLILNPSFVSLQRNRAASIAKDTNADCLLVKRFPHDGGDNLLCEPDGNKTSLL